MMGNALQIGRPKNYAGSYDGELLGPEGGSSSILGASASGSLLGLNEENLPEVR